MKPRPLAYARPGTLTEAFDLLEQHGDEARVLAGGQSLMASLAMRLSSPAVLVDIAHIGELKGINVGAGTIRIGALTRHVELQKSPTITEQIPLLAAAVPHIAHHAIRTRGTIGGSLAYADPAAELPVVCRALEATMVLQSRNGERRVAADDFFLGLFQTALKPGELLTAVELPVAKPGERFGFQELARRHGDYAIVGLAARARFDGGRLTGVRLVYLGAGNRPMLAGEAAAALEGKAPDAAAVAAAKAALTHDLDPPTDLNGPPEMKLHLARVLTGRVLDQMLA
jgi:carbon-monoxide dehydrogenase medium subunit